MNPLMFGEVGLIGEAPAAVVARVGLFARVKPLMFDKIRASGELFAAL